MDRRAGRRRNPAAPEGRSPRVLVGTGIGLLLRALRKPALSLHGNPLPCLRHRDRADAG